MKKTFMHIRFKPLIAAIVCLAVSLSFFISASAEDPKVTKPVISDSKLRAVTEKTTVAAFKSIFTNPRNYPFYFYTSDGEPLWDSSPDYIATGMTIRFEYANSYDEYPVIVKGDVNGSGVIDAGDYAIIKAYIGKKTVIDGSYKLAADTNGDNNITATDYLQIKYHLTLAYNLFEGENYTADVFDDPDVSNNNESGWTSGWYS